MRGRRHGVELDRSANERQVPAADGVRSAGHRTATVTEPQPPTSAAMDGIVPDPSPPSRSADPRAASEAGGSGGRPDPARSRSPEPSPPADANTAGPEATAGSPQQGDAAADGYPGPDHPVAGADAQVRAQDRTDRKPAPGADVPDRKSARGIGRAAAARGSHAADPVSTGNLFADRYRLRDLVGSGGMGRLWVARDEMLARDVAIKEIVLPDWMRPDDRADLYERTLVEARAVARLNSPYVVQIFDVVYQEDRPWIVMEYVPARSLYQIIQSDGRVTPQEAARIGLAVLSALDAAHGAGVLHRDVKPGNVLVADDGRVVLTDFGLATFVDGGAAMTMPGVVLGSPQYTAPERAHDGVSTPEADLWSLGATLYAAVEGHAPFARSTPMATLAALAAEPPDPAPHAGPLRPVLDGLLCKDPAGRMGREGTRRLLAPLVAGDLIPRPRRASTNGRQGAVPRPVSGTPDRPAASPAGTTAPAAVVADSQDDRRPAVSGNTADQPRRFWAGWLVIAAVIMVLAVVAVVIADLRGRRPQASPAPTPPAKLSASPSRHAEAEGGSSAPARVPVAALTVISPCAAPAPARASAPSEANPPGREAFVLPQYWRWYHDPGGFRVATHSDWRAAVQGGAVCFHDSAGVRTLGIKPLRGRVDPVVHIREDESSLRAGHASANYHPVRIVRSADLQAADWEYRCTAPDGKTPLHAQRRTIQMSDGRAYDIFWQTSEADWQNEQDYLTLVLVSFWG